MPPSRTSNHLFQNWTLPRSLEHRSLPRASRTSQNQIRLRVQGKWAGLSRNTPRPGTSRDEHSSVKVEELAWKKGSWTPKATGSLGLRKGHVHNIRKQGEDATELTRQIFLLCAPQAWLTPPCSQGPYMQEWWVGAFKSKWHRHRDDS